MSRSLNKIVDEYNALPKSGIIYITFPKSKAPKLTPNKHKKISLTVIP